MKLDRLRFRQVHLDFHTSGLIPGIGEKFDRKQWQERLQAAAVDSITCFSCCHHGYSYHPTVVGRMHPHLKFNLLRAQLDACKEIDVNVPVYLTAGVNNMVFERHPEWTEVDCNGKYQGWCNSPLVPGFHKLCFNTPYLDYLCALIQEAVKLFPDGDGIFLDIINQGECCCPKCMADMLKQGFDPTRSDDRKKFADQVLLNYYRRTAEAVWSIDPEMPLFHNSGDVTPGKTGILQYFSHLELESLPTGGWGYDHYPMSIAYTRNLGMEILGMTGKFHTTWGEFGGFKHPNALRYECSAMLANGSKCSVGDQLHPSGELDESTCKLIGSAYCEVRDKEPYCENATSAADIAVLSPAACRHERNGNAEIGVSRLLLEEHMFFDMLDAEMPFDRYRCLILPDCVPLTPELAARIQAFVAAGGKVIASHASLLVDSKSILPLPGEIGEDSEFSPDYIDPAPDFAVEPVTTPFVMYGRSKRLKLAPGARSLGKILDPYFNRTYAHFCSHQHTPYAPEETGFSAGVMTDNVLYFAHPVFSDYRDYGAVNVRQFVAGAIRQFLGNGIRLECGLPSTGRVTIMEQKDCKRYIVHALYAPAILRGGRWFDAGNNIWKQQHYEVIEDLITLRDVPFSVRVPQKVKRITLEPQGVETALEYDDDGRCRFVIPELDCHQMVALHY